MTKLRERARKLLDIVAGRGLYGEEDVDQFVSIFTKTIKASMPKEESDGYRCSGDSDHLEACGGCQEIFTDAQIVYNQALKDFTSNLEWNPGYESIFQKGQRSCS